MLTLTLSSPFFSLCWSALQVAAYITMDMVRQVHLLEGLEMELQELVAQQLRPQDLVAGACMGREEELGGGRVPGG